MLLEPVFWPFGMRVSKILRVPQLAASLSQSDVGQPTSFRHLPPSVTNNAGEKLVKHLTMKIYTANLPFMPADFSLFNVMNSLSMACEEKHFVPRIAFACIIQILD